MPKIAVFDSGLGSLSVIRPIQKKTKLEIIYFADQENYPYGTKSSKELSRIIKSTISKLEERFSPDVIVVGSNTPSLLLGINTRRKIVGVLPPLHDASKKTRTRSIGILATRSVIKSKKLQQYIRKNVPKNIQVTKIDASPLVELVESGKFMSEKKQTIKKIKKILYKIPKNKVDTITLSSTHLPFLLPMLQQVFPHVSFLDPADSIARKVASMLSSKKSRSSLRIYASGDIRSFQTKLHKIGIKNRVLSL
ncbi:MAG: aspartate/glutamate racemase family protein [Nitrososphaera sp.]|jgi:glutamate racemase